MIRCHTFRTILLTTSLALLASNVYGQIFSSSSTVDVRNGIDWKIVGGTSFAGGTRGVGDNTRKVGASTQVDPFTSGPYSAGSIQHPLKTLTAAAGTSSTFSAVTVAPTPLSNGAYNYQMSTFAQTNAAPGGLGPFFCASQGQRSSTDHYSSCVWVDLQLIVWHATVDHCQRKRYSISRSLGN